MRVGAPFLVLALFTAAPVGFAGDPAPEPVAFGTAHPSILDVADPSGRWIVVCQARADTTGDGRVAVLFDTHHGSPDGDALVPYLVIGGGEGTAIDTLLAVDPRSRFVVGRPKGRVTLYDTRTGTATDLTPAPSAQGEPPSVAAWASFDDAGRLLLTGRVGGHSSGAVAALVVRELESGVEWSLDPGAGLLVRAALSGDGTSIVAVVVTEDTDGDGELRAPKLHTSFYEGRCGGPAVAGSVLGWSGDRPTHRVLSLDGSVRRDAPGFQRFVGRRWVRRLADGALVLESAGETIPVAPAAAKAVVLASDDETATLLWASAASDEATPVFALGPSGAREIGVHVQVRKPYSGSRHRPARIMPIGGWDDRLAFDCSRGVAVPMHGRLVTSHGPHVLVVRNEGAVVMDVDAGTATPLPGTARIGYGPVWRAGALAAVGGFVIDLPHAKVVGTYPYPYANSPLAPECALRDDGWLLRSAGRSGFVTGEYGYTAPRGPFRWEPPDPVK